MRVLGARAAACPGPWLSAARPEQRRRTAHQTSETDTVRCSHVDKLRRHGPADGGAQPRCPDVPWPIQARRRRTPGWAPGSSPNPTDHPLRCSPPWLQGRVGQQRSDTAGPISAGAGQAPAGLRGGRWPELSRFPRGPARPVSWRARAPVSRDVSRSRPYRITMDEARSSAPSQAGRHPAALRSALGADCARDTEPMEQRTPRHGLPRPPLSAAFPRRSSGSKAQFGAERCRGARPSGSGALPARRRWARETRGKRLGAPCAFL